MDTSEDFFTRSRLLLGDDAMLRLERKRVILFGVGGVGSWCAEALIRTGLRRLTIVDFDTVSCSNVNRQLMATSASIGQVKVEAMRARLMSINPNAEVVAVSDRVTAENLAEFHLEDYDYVIDAIDSVSDKAELLLYASACGAKVLSSMGAALKLDPSQVRTDEFWKVKGCPLARALRNKFKREQRFPKSKIRCVYSTEQPIKKTDRELNAPNGSLVHITAIFGMTLASMVITDIR